MQVPEEGNGCLEICFEEQYLAEISAFTKPMYITNSNNRQKM